VTAIVNAALSLPFCVRILVPALSRVEENYGRLGSSLGITGWDKARLIYWPALRAPLGFASGLAAALSMGDLGVIALFAPVEGATLPLLMYRLMGSYQMEAAAGVALILVAISTLALIGPSGAGKSLFLGGLAGFDTKHEGELTIDGTDMGNISPQNRPVTLMFQDHNLFPHLSVTQNVGLGIDPGLRLDQALIRRRKLLLLDEPFSALGPGLRREMLALVQKIRAQQEATLIFVTHTPEDAKSADLVSFVNDGAVQKPTPSDAFFANPPATLRDYL